MHGAHRNGLPHTPSRLPQFILRRHFIYDILCQSSSLNMSLLNLSNMGHIIWQTYILFHLLSYKSSISSLLKYLLKFVYITSTTSNDQNDYLIPAISMRIEVEPPMQTFHKHHCYVSQNQLVFSPLKHKLLCIPHNMIME